MFHKIFKLVKAAIVTKITGGQYNSYIDSLGTSFNFLKQFKDVSEKVKDPLNNLEQLQSKLQQTEQIKKFISERKEQINPMLSKSRFFIICPIGI